MHIRNRCVGNGLVEPRVVVAINGAIDRVVNTPALGRFFDDALWVRPVAVADLNHCGGSKVVRRFFQVLHAGL